MTSDTSLLLLRVTYGANVVVAGTVGLLAFVSPPLAARTVFDAAFEPSGAMRILGSLWLAIAIVSALGLRYPHTMALVLLIQLIYKGLWLLFAAAPSLVRGDHDRLPLGMAAFFLLWVIWLPFVIPWRALFASGSQAGVGSPQS